MAPRSTSQIAYQERNAEAINARQRASYAANREEKRAYHAAWRDANRDKVNEQARETYCRQRSSPEKLEKIHVRRRGYYVKNKEHIQNKAKESRKDPKAWLKYALGTVRKRCRANNIPFDLSVDTVELPTTCPVTLNPIEYGGGRAAGRRCPSIDRVRPDRGYVAGNVRVISWEANVMKQDCTDPLVFERLAAYVRANLEGTVS